MSNKGELDRPAVRWRAIGAAVLRESRGAKGRLIFFTACLAIGVAAVVGVSALIAAVQAGMRSQSRELLSGDLRLSARRALPEEELVTFFADTPHERVDLRELAAMASRPRADGGEGDAAAESRLIELKVVDGGYPLYGELVLAPADAELAELGGEGAFVGPELMASLDLKLGDEFRVGGASFRVLAEVLDEPDRLDFAMTLGPRVFLSRAGFERTDLADVRNRVRYSRLYAFPDDPDENGLQAIVGRLKRALGDPEYLSLRTRGEAQQGLTQALERVEHFLGLVALLSLLLGGIGVSQILRAWLAGRAQSVAVLRCFGFRAREIAAAYLGHVALLALAGCLAGGLIGALLPWLVRAQAPELFRGGSQFLWQPTAVLRGIALGLFVAPLFSLPPLTSVWRVPPAAVLRAEAVPLPAPRIVRFGALALLLAGVWTTAWFQSEHLLIASAFSGGLLLLAGLLWSGARLATWIASRLPRGRLGPYLEHGLAALSRPDAGTTGAIVALGLGVMVILTMLLVETRMNEALTDSVPEDAPSVFLVDIQPEQWDGVRAVLEEREARGVDTVPVVMARLRSIDGRTAAELAAESEDDDRSAWRFTREQRLTWMQELPADNVVVEGALWSEPERDEVSLEERFAKELGARVGSELEFDVQGIPQKLLVTSLRTVEWESFGINFFLVVEPGVLDKAPHFRISTARFDTPDEEYALQNELAASFPNVTLLRIRPILEKIAGIMNRIAIGIRSLGLFTILTGLVILGGAVGANALRRAREAALLKTLGVTRGGVTLLFAVEYALSGLIAGSIGGLGALVLSWAYFEYLVELPSNTPLVALPLAALIAAALATLSGLTASLRALRARPMETLRH